MKTLVLFILIFGGVVWCGSASALTDNAREVIHRYKESLKTADHERIDQAWKALDRHTEAVNYLKTLRPRLYFSYKAWESARQIDEIKNKIALRMPITESEVARTRFEVRDQYTNADFAADFPNHERPNNREDIERRR